MASLNFAQEITTFRNFYDSNRKQLVAAKNAYIQIIGALIKRLNIDGVTKIEGRVKEKEECIKKFHRKYQNKLEADEQPYEIKDFISDLVGIRIVCLYEDQIAVLSEVLQQHFKTLDVTDKISSVENTEDTFRYKGFHMDLVLNDEMASRSKYQAYADRPFEVQIRSLIQDAWSVLDHKIKYKKSIPQDLKRRINILSALFEMADREFKEIRNATTELIQQETVPPIGDASDDFGDGSGQAAANGTRTVTAFNFLRIAGHFFRDFEFNDSKVDDFVHEILKMDSGLQKSDLHKCMTEKLKIVRDYRDHCLKKNPDKTFSPYASIRHCLYLYDSENFGKILSKGGKKQFTDWLNES